MLVSIESYIQRNIPHLGIQLCLRIFFLPPCQNVYRRVKNQWSWLISSSKLFGIFLTFPSELMKSINPASSLKAHQRTVNCFNEISPVCSNLRIVGAGTPVCSDNARLDFFKAFLLLSKNTLIFSWRSQGV